MEKRHALTDLQWEAIAPHLPRVRHHVLPARQVLDGALWIARTGAPWRDLPARFGGWSTVYRRFSRWQSQERLMAAFRAIVADRPTVEISIDSTVVRVHRVGSGAPKKTERKRSAARGAD